MGRNITTGVLSVAGTKVVVLVLGLATSPLLTRLLDDGYGDYAFLLSAFSLFMLFVSSGITDGVRKHVAERRPHADWEGVVAGFYFRAAVALAVAGAGVLALVAYSGVAAALLGPKFTTYCYVLAALVLAAQLRAYARRTLMGLGHEPYSESLKVLHKAVFVAAGVGLAWLGYGVTGVLVGHVVASLLTALVGLGLLARYVSPTAVANRLPRSVSRRDILAFNGLSVVLALLLTSLYQVDVLMLRPLAGAGPTKYYKVALVFAELLWFVPLSLQTVLLHSTSSLWSSGDGARAGRIAARVTRYTVLLTALLAVGIGSLAGDALPLLYPDEYVASVTPLLLLLPGAVGFAVARPILAVAQGKGDLGPLIRATGVAAGLNLVLNAALIPTFGMRGAAVATSVGYGSMAVLHVAAARRVGFDPISDLRPIPVGVTVALGSVPIVWAARALHGPWPALAVVPVVGLASFGLAAFLTGALDTDEVTDTVGRFPGLSSLVGSPTVVSDGGASRAGDVAQKTLVAVGVVLFVAGVGIAVSGGSVTDLQGPANNGSAPTTTAPTTTDAPTGTTTDAPSTRQPTTDAPTATTDPPGSTSTSAPPPTSNPTTEQPRTSSPVATTPRPTTTSTTTTPTTTTDTATTTTPTTSTTTTTPTTSTTTSTNTTTQEPTTTTTTQQPTTTQTTTPTTTSTSTSTSTTNTSTSTTTTSDTTSTSTTSTSTATSSTTTTATTSTTTTAENSTTSTSSGGLF